MFEELVEALKTGLDNPEILPDELTIIKLSEEEKRKILTPKRLELIRTIKKEKPKSIKELARKVERPREAVSRDLRILKTYGLLKLVQKGRRKIPKTQKEGVLIPLTVGK